MPGRPPPGPDGSAHAGGGAGPGARVGPAPAGLVVASAVTALEGLLVTGVGVWLLLAALTSQASNAAVGWGSATYFVVLGPLVLLVAAALWRRRSWALGASLAVQLMALLVSITMLQGGFLVGALPLAAAAVAAGAALLRPSTRAAVGRE